MVDPPPSLAVEQQTNTPLHSCRFGSHLARSEASAGAGWRPAWWEVGLTRYWVNSGTIPIPVDLHTAIGTGTPTRQSSFTPPVSASVD